MGISFTDFTGGSSGANDFAISLGSSGNNVFQLDKSYAAGSYSITVASETDFFDIYAISADGSFCGYTNTLALESSDKFNQLVVLGLPNNDQVFFEYRGEISTSSAAGSIPSAGAYISSVSVSSLQDIDDTTTITGGNFANDVEVYFIGQSLEESLAKNVVVVSTNQLIATRPDSFSIGDSPYTIKVVNPGIPSPDGSNLFKLDNSVTAGTNPVWQTESNQFYNVGNLNTITLVASDTEASDVDYVITTGSLPAGLTLDGETGVISGTPSGGADGDQTVFTVRATDAGGNFVDRQFTFIANGEPAWVTTNSDIQSSVFLQAGQTISFQFIASSGSAGGSLSYSIQSGSLPPGTSLSSSGLLTGSLIDGNFSFVVRATDESNLFSDREFSFTVEPGIVEIEYLVVAGGGGGGGGNGGGGGAGGYRSSVTGELSGGNSTAENNLSLFLNTDYSVTVGGGGAGGPSQTRGSNGSDSILASITSVGGGGAGSQGYLNSPDPQYKSQDGGSGGGAGYNDDGGNPVSGQGHRGGNVYEGWGNNFPSSFKTGGGGGAGGPGTDGTFSSGNGDAGDGIQSSITGSAVYRAGGGGGSSTYSSGGTGGLGGGGEGGYDYNANSTPGAANTGGGGGGVGGTVEAGSAGGSGIVIVRYPSNITMNIGAGLTSSTTTVGEKKVTQITSGIGNVSWL